MTSPQPTLGQVLQLTTPTSVLTQDVIRRIVAALGSRPLDEIASLNGMALALRLQSEVPDSAKLGDLLAVAEAVLQQCVRASSTASAVGQPAVNVTVQTPRSLKDLDFPDLLALLADKPERAGEIMPYLLVQPVVRAAAVKTNALALVRGGKIDADATRVYIAELAKPGRQPQRDVDGIRPVPFAQALGTLEVPYIHPFTGEPVVGKDKWGVDYSADITDELHCALIWARRTGHDAWPAVVDQFTAAREVLATPLPARWKLILEDYLAARAAQHPAAMVSRWALPSGGGATPFGGSAPEPERSESWYRQQLENAGQSGRRAMSGGISLSRALVFGDIEAMSGGVRLTDCIVLGSITAMSGGLRGTVYIPKNSPLPSAMSGGNEMRVYRLNYEGLYKKAQELGLL